jgi:hypothetical protein
MLPFSAASAGTRISFAASIADAGLAGLNEQHQFGIDREHGVGLRLLNACLNFAKQFPEIGWSSHGARTSADGGANMEIRDYILCLFIPQRMHWRRRTELPFE